MKRISFAVKKIKNIFYTTWIKVILDNDVVLSVPFGPSGKSGNPTASITAMMCEQRWLNEHEQDSRGKRRTACKLPEGDFTIKAWKEKKTILI